VGNDSPAELLNDPCGTVKAGSILPSDCSVGDGRAAKLTEDDSRGLLLKLNEFLALVKKVAALVTVLLRRFFSLLGL
jgi:hypothetical protein